MAVHLLFLARAGEQGAWAGVRGFRGGLRSGQVEAWATPLFRGGEFTQAHG